MYVNVTIETVSERGNKVERKYFRLDSKNLDKALDPLFDFHIQYEKKLKLREEHTNKFIPQVTKRRES